MNRVIVGLLALVALMSSVAEAHDEKDPVCGMRVEIEKAHAKAQHAGMTYYFCSQSCTASFSANPDKYVGALRLIEYQGKNAIAFTLRPREPKPGEVARFYLQVGPAKEGAMGPDPNTTRKLSYGLAYLYLVDRSGEPKSEAFRLNETEERGTFGFSKLVSRDAEYRIFFVAQCETGESIRAGFGFFTAGAIPKDEHDHAVPPEPSPGKGHDEHKGMPLHSGPLTMQAQHETMSRIGEHWVAIGDTLFSETQPVREVQEHMNGLVQWEKNLGGFMLHKFEQDKPEFLKYAQELQQRIAVLGEAVRADRLDQARSKYMEIDSQSCVKCHLKFRWGVVADLSRFPDLRRTEYAREKK